MIIKRMAEGIRAQNWFTVIVEIFIVVLGVFIGIQVSNWNDDRANDRIYRQAIERFNVEARENLATIDAETIVIERNLAAGRAGLDALLACAEGADAINAVNAGIAQVRGTRGVELRAKALTELTSNPVLLAKQSNAARKRFADALYFLELASSILQRFEPDSLSTWAADNPTLAIERAETWQDTFFGIDYAVPRYPLVLNVPIQQACKDIELQQWLLKWEVWQTNVSIFNKKLRQEYVETQALTQALLTELAP